MPDQPYDCSLPEHPDAYRLRLQELGVWDKAYKILIRERNRAYYDAREFEEDKNCPLTDDQNVRANKRAYDAVFEKFPPAEDAAPLESLAEFVKGRRKIKKRTKLPPLTVSDEMRFDSIGETDDHISEVLWCYRNLKNYRIQPEDCPSRGAWSMLEYARQNEGWFFEKMYRPVAQQLEKQKNASGSEEYKPSKLEKMAVGELDQMIKEGAALAVSDQPA